MVGPSASWPPTAAIPSHLMPEWGGAKVTEAEAQLPGGAAEIEYVRVKGASAGAAEGHKGDDSGWEAAHRRPR